MKTYSFWNTDYPVQWVSCVDPIEDMERMCAREDLCCVTAEDLLSAIHCAVLDSRKDEMYARFCTPERLLVVVPRAETLENDALQFELSVILSVRRVDHLPTRFLFPTDFDPAVVTNQCLSVFLHMAGRGVPVQRLYAERGLMRRLSEIARLSMSLDDPLFPEEDEANADGFDAEGRSLTILREIKARIRALERQVAHIDAKKTSQDETCDFPL